MLAGGSGKRMGGCNKANLEYDKRTFAERIAHELTETRLMGLTGCFSFPVTHRFSEAHSSGK